MVVLKKIKGSTLMETLVASILIVVIFMMASMILNNLFSASINSNTRSVNSFLNEMEYLYLNEDIVLPYNEEIESWIVNIEKFNENHQNTVIIEAFNVNTKKVISRKIVAN